MSPEFREVLPADAFAAAATRERFAHFCAARGVAEETVHDAALALQEVLDNVVEHAYRDLPGGEIVVEARCAGGAVSVTVRDRGPEFDPLAPPPPRADALAAGGLGLRLVHALVDVIRWERKEGENRLDLVKFLDRGVG